MLTHFPASQWELSDLASIWPARTTLGRGLQVTKISHDFQFPNFPGGGATVSVEVLLFRWNLGRNRLGHTNDNDNDYDYSAAEEYNVLLAPDTPGLPLIHTEWLGLRVSRVSRNGAHVSFSPDDPLRAELSFVGAGGWQSVTCALNVVSLGMDNDSNWQNGFREVLSRFDAEQLVMPANGSLRMALRVLHAPSPPGSPRLTRLLPSQAPPAPARRGHPQAPRIQPRRLSLDSPPPAPTASTAPSSARLASQLVAAHDALRQAYDALGVRVEVRVEQVGAAGLGAGSGLGAVSGDEDDAAGPSQPLPKRRLRPDDDAERCPVCFDPFGTEPGDQRIASMLCGHATCAGCCLKLYGVRPQTGPAAAAVPAQCPVCRVPVNSVLRIFS